MTNIQLPFDVKGHVLIEDDLGDVLLDESNAVHPQNMARVIARALSLEDNFWIHRIAFGNGGTQIDGTGQIEYNTVNDGQAPDVRTWDSRLYNETYSEIINEGQVVLNPELGTDPGSSGPNVPSRPGGGADPSGDPAAIPHVSGPGVRSNELGITSEVVITAILNPGEPTGQFNFDSFPPGSPGSEDPDSDFTFDEIGLYTTGAPAIDSAGYQYVDVGNKRSTDDSGLLVATLYDFQITVDGGVTTTITFTTPAGGGSGPGGEILYGDIAEAINTGDVAWGFTGSNPLPGGAQVSITDPNNDFASFAGAQTFGFLQFCSPTTGVTSTIVLGAGTTNDMFAALEGGLGGTLVTPVDGLAAGVQNDPVNPETERERLLTHIIFSPVLKSANRTLQITYTLTVSVQRSSPLGPP